MNTMKKIIALLMTTWMMSTTHAGIIAAPVSTEPVATSVSPADVLGKMDAQTFLSLTPSKVKEITGKRMTLKEKIVLKLTQKQMKKQMRKGKEVNHSNMMKRFGDNFNLGAFLLGVFLSFIGVLIVYVTYWEDPSVARKSAWRGLLTGLILVLGILRLVLA